jgi:hypothetical protein
LPPWLEAFVTSSGLTGFFASILFYTLVIPLLPLLIWVHQSRQIVIEFRLRMLSLKMSGEETNAETKVKKETAAEIKKREADLQDIVREAVEDKDFVPSESR